MRLVALFSLLFAVQPPSALSFTGLPVKKRQPVRDELKRGQGRSSGVKTKPGFLVIGHSGARDHAPENTLPSFRKAMELGANALETDLTLTKDRQVVLYHDAHPNSPLSLVRQLGIGIGVGKYLPVTPPIGSRWRKPVERLSLAELREHFGYRKRGNILKAVFSRKREQGISIPTIADFMQWAGKEPRLQSVFLDIKLTSNKADQVGVLYDQVVAQLDRAGLQSSVQIYLMSIVPEVIDRLVGLVAQDRRTNVKVMADFEKAGALTKARGVTEISSGDTPYRAWPGYRRELSRLVKARNEGHLQSVFAWSFVEKTRRNIKMIETGVDGIMTNRPDKVRELLAH
ncbi:MAG: hypothetical protein H6707_20080 [Deltaproteobacteria bacterium]|nr:hypothetical protein [Deltaproteobacteria bacterium]